MIDASVLVVGGGAIGGVTAAKLTGAVRRVVVLDASEEHVARLNDGLKLDVLGEERTVRVEAVTEPPDEEFDFVLITLKAAHHEAVKPLEGRRSSASATAWCRTGWRSWSARAT